MKQTLINSGIVTALFVGLWVALDVPLRGYTATPDAPPNNTATDKRSPSSQEALMKDGLFLLYTQKNPTAAVSKFSAIIDQDGAHYGAAFQYAKALDMSGDLEAAQTAWGRFLPMAQESQDTDAISWASDRIDRLSAAINDCKSLMNQGVEMLHNEQNTTGAIGALSAVLSQWPTHYGAAYQLAQALERDGQAANALKAWQRVMVQAKQIDAHEDIAAARSAIERIEQVISKQ